ncbi:GAF domain-containing sensor histidine kinase [Kitasatospora sp. NPDC096147]|uniref:sensor histidine kinase n=1 Tax=Kitasatospora sp. NPDC096147 TaxID=3364093 RepID=UPI00380215FD
MSQPETTRTARALAGSGLALLAALLWAALAIANPGRGFTEEYLYDAGWVAFGLTFALSGLALVLNRTASGLGALLLATGLLIPVGTAAKLLAGLAGAGPSAMWLVTAVVYASEVCFVAVLIALPLWLPDLRLPPAARWALPVVVLLALPLGMVNTCLSDEFYGRPNPLAGSALNAWLDGWFGLAVSYHVLAAATGLALLVAAVRWARSPGPRPYQRELVAAYLIWNLLVTVPYYLDYRADWLVYATFAVGVVTWALVPAAALRRDHSLGLDRATRRYLAGYAFGTLLFVAVTAAAALAQLLLPGGSPAARWALLLSVGALGALLHPAAHFVTRLVDQYYYGERAQPYQLVRSLAERMSHTVSPAEAPPLLCRTVVEALGLPGARVQVETRAGARELAGLGELGPAAESFPLSYEGAVIGHLTVPPRSGQRELDRQDRELLRLLADQASPAIASVGLYEDLQDSRKRIVLAREEERRRLRHDLHDGLGPALSGLRLQVDAAQTGLEPGSAAAGSLTAASAGIGSAITELRRITDGLAPAALDGEGLAGALRGLAEGLGHRALRVTLELDPDPLPPLPAAVEVAVYRISGEALNNVVRHAGATSARLSLRVGPEEVTVEAVDDGAGFPGHRSTAGVGLRSMAERAEELGGSFTAVNDSGGARVRAVFPRSHG